MTTLERVTRLLFGWLPVSEEPLHVVGDRTQVAIEFDGPAEHATATAQSGFDVEVAQVVHVDLIAEGRRLDLGRLSVLRRRGLYSQETGIEILRR